MVLSRKDRAVNDNSTAVISLDVEEERRHQQIAKNQAAIDLLQSWLLNDEKEQQETLQYLMKALDDDRLSHRKLFS